MNFVLIMADTMRADHLGCYGNKVVKTPCLDKLASEGCLFERAYCASWPTIPNRTDLFTGRYGEPLHPWQPLDWDALTLPEVMRKNGYVTMLINDTPHLINYGYGFDRPFHAWWMIRGNEVDRFNTDHGPVELGCAVEKLRSPFAETFHAQYLRNIGERRAEEDYFAPKVMSTAMNWLDRNYMHEKFFLWIDCFDPHEPWDPPQHYVDLYDRGFKGTVPTNFFSVPNITKRELKHIRACYAGEVTMVDRWIGRVIERIEDLGIADKTAIIVMSDHGTGLGDHGIIQKRVPAYEEVSRIVWIMKAPKGRYGGKRFQALVQPPDLMPTVLEMAGVKQPEGMQGTSLVPVMKGKVRNIRDIALTGPGSWTEGPTNLTVTSSRYAFFNTAERKGWALFDLKKDPKQNRNIIKKHPEITLRLHRKLLRMLLSLGAPKRLVEAYAKGTMSAEPQLPAYKLSKRAAVRERGLRPENFIVGRFS